MSELTITHNGIAQTAEAGFHQRKGIVKRINPTVLAGATNTDKVLFNTIEVPNAVRVKGGTAYIRSITLLSYDTEAHNISLFFTRRRRRRRCFTVQVVLCSPCVHTTQSSH